MSQFSPLKMIQAAGVLFSQHGGQMGRLRLIKLLYIADRESLVERHRFISHDTFVAMDNGPVLSHTYNLLKGMTLESSQWDQYFQKVNLHWEMKMIQSPPRGLLSRWEIAKLEDVSTKLADQDDYDLVSITHGFQEWIENAPPAKSCKTIPLRDIIRAVGLDDSVWQEMQNEIDERNAIRQAVAAANRGG